VQYDVFICHASEDKEDFVRPLAELLRQQHIDVWYDEFSLTIGDSLTQKIDEGLAKSRFGIVVLSPNFFNKPWAKRELNGLTVREMVEKRDLILPIWHRVSVQDVMQYSPPLADKKAASSADGISSVIRDLTKKINPENSPLLIARDHLIKYDLTPPPISDEWWLDMIEYKEFLKYPDLNSHKRWIFPLPYPNEDNGKKRGLNISSTALQLDWSFEGEELDISPTTHPDRIHEFIHRWPGLYECARKNPYVLALYVPQLTIPGFDAGFEDVFDKLLKQSSNKASRFFSYGRPDTIDGKEPLCGDIVALRHPTYGNYTEEELAYRYFYAHDTSYMRWLGDAFEGLVWLLSNDSAWLPEKYHQMLVRGLSMRDRWLTDSHKYSNPFVQAMLTKERKQFKLTKSIKSGLKNLIEEAIKNLGISQDSNQIIQKFIETDIFNKCFDYRELLDEKRANK